MNVVEVLCGQEERVQELRRQGDGLEEQRRCLQREADELRRERARLAEVLRATGGMPLAWGELDRTSPISPEWGMDRGRCVDRYYIEGFVEAHQEDVRGTVLEVHDRDYTSQFGGVHVAHSDVIDIDPANPRATIVADLRRATAIPSDRYDCVILTQTLHCIDDTRAVLAECARIMKPGGVLLATLPCASKVSHEQGLDGDFWRFTTASARRLFAEVFPPDHLQVRAHGNVLVTVAFLYGLACEELTHGEFEHFDPYFPLLVSVRAQKPSTASAL